MGIGIGNSNVSTNVVNNYFGGSSPMGMMQQNPMMQMMQMMTGALQGLTGGPCQEMMGGMGMPGMGMPGMGMPGMDGMSGFSPMMGNNIGNFLGTQQNPMMQMMQMMMMMMQMMMMMMGGGANPFMGGMMPGMMGGMPGMGGGMPGMGGGMPGMGGGFPGMGGGYPGMGGMGGGMPYAGAYAGPNGAGAFAGTGGAGGAGPYTGPMGTGSGAAAVNMGRQFLGQNAIDIKGKMPHFTAAGGQTNNCADFVSSCLESQGLIKGHHINVKEMEQSLIKQGYRQIPLNQAKAGDVWMNSSRGHTELVQGFQNGKLKLIGSNNDRPGHQVISEGSATSGVVYSRQ
ncbi:MAG: peptidoglycan amidohydrolase family protein [Candidatus Eremiobacterota bacterium]